MTLHVRSFHENDLTTVVTIAQCADYNSWTKAVFKDCLKEHYINWVCSSVDSIDSIGFLVALINREECQLMNIGIDKAYWHRGYGNQLLTYFIETIKKRSDVQRILLEVRRSNAAAIALYKKKDFEYKGCRKGYYVRGAEKEDALMFALDLT